jgi:hypothetical protein
MAKQAEAERERRAKVISAEGEYQASTKLAAAAEIIEQFPGAMQLRYLQTLVEIAAENNSTTLFPIPIEIFRGFVEPGRPASDEAKAKALRAAAETMVEALPAGTDRGTLAEVAKKVLGMTAGRERKKEPSGDEGS